jgi:hypothetical protein
MVAHIGAWTVRLPTNVRPYGALPKLSTMSAHISWFCAIRKLPMVDVYTVAVW